MRFSKQGFLIAAGLLAFSGGIANASTNGFQNIYGSNSDHAIFDFFHSFPPPEGSGDDLLTFPKYNLAAIDPILEDNGGAGALAKASMFDITLSTDMTAGNIVSGLRIYNGNGGANTNLNISLAGTALEDISSLSLQVRLTKPSGITYDYGSIFSSVTLNGVAGTAVITADGGLDGNYGVVKWTWNNLNLQESDAFTIGIESHAAGHISVDSLRVDAIPEPSTYALIGAGLAGAALLRRRRRAA